MTQIDQIIADALAGSPETHVAILAREVVRLREAPAVVVNRDCGSCGSYQDIGGDCTKCDGCGIGEMPHWTPSRSLAGIRAIPADRVLGEGMVQVDRAALAILIDCATGAIRHRYEGSCPDEVEGPNVRDNGCVVCNAIETIRANQGGADHD